MPWCNPRRRGRGLNLLMLNLPALLADTGVELRMSLSLLYCDNSSADDVSTTPVNKAVNNATAKYFLVINHSEEPLS
jgi:hypothetical protein